MRQASGLSGLGLVLSFICFSDYVEDMRDEGVAFLLYFSITAGCGTVTVSSFVTAIELLGL